MNRKELRTISDRILRGLAQIYYKDAYKSPEYRDPQTGGIYEHKLANKLGFELNAGDRSPPEFLEGCRVLEEKGYVRRVRRQPEFPELGIWPTVAGLDRAEYIALPWYMKPIKQVGNRWPEILIALVTAIVTTVVTLLLASLLGWFGLGDADEQSSNHEFERTALRLREGMSEHDGSSPSTAHLSRRRSTQC